ncbi:hypothetical protein [Winogradskyella luteola]|uniref:SRPBCC family protein n=1 Tax=Winogradskyella luteola TaxID=2828330 RepID=A0A9X1JRX2_9FLAO|nr:hypothetical protein [Winogradskyella luteola]MBV7270338.1 hypothetical protein [Winogradskyella luteola]
MQVVNFHKRVIHEPKEKVSELLKTLASSEDLVWPYENWPAIRFNDGLKVGSKGGHGRIRYTITEFELGDYIKFEFSKPEGFNGTHKLKIKGIDDTSSEIFHEIKMQTSFKALLLWVFMVKWLHNALIEEAFDKVENHFTETKKESRYNFWVRFLREAYKRTSFQTKYS